MTLPQRLSVDDLFRIKLRSGLHSSRGYDSVCAMEAVAWLAGELHSDHPACTCHVLGAYVRSINDSGILFSNTRERNQLLPVLPSLIGTVGDRVLRQQRAYLFADYATRRFTVIALRATGEDSLATMLEALPRVIDMTSARNASIVINAVNDRVVTSDLYAADAASYAADAASCAFRAADMTSDLYAADAASYAADAASYAAAAASCAASAISRAASSADERRFALDRMRAMCLDALRDAIAIQ